MTVTTVTVRVAENGKKMALDFLQKHPCLGVMSDTMRNPKRADAPGGHTQIQKSCWNVRTGKHRWHCVGQRHHQEKMGRLVPRFSSDRKVAVLNLFIWTDMVLYTGY